MAFTNSTSYLVGILQIASGIVLVKSVYSVHRFFKKNNAESYINTGMLLRHAAAFGLYLLTCSAYYITWAFFTMDESQEMFHFFLLALLCYKIGSFIAELLLVGIFWDLGCKNE